MTNPGDMRACRDLVTRFPDLGPILDEHLSDNGGLLPHVFLSDAVRYFACEEPERRADARRFVDWMDRTYDEGDEGVQDLIGASGVEMIPDPGQPGAQMRDWLSPSLRRIDPWATSEGLD